MSDMGEPSTGGCDGGSYPKFDLGPGVRQGIVRCDAGWCNETHPLEHEMLGDESFGTGRWLGWVYLDLNRPDLLDRELRFCSPSCCIWWLDREIMTAGRREKTALDRALRAPRDEVARSAAGLQKRNDDVLAARRALKPKGAP